MNGGLANILAVAYLRPMMASKILGWDLLRGHPDVDKEMEDYFAIVARGGSRFVTGDRDKEGYTLGGMSCKCCEMLLDHLLFIAKPEF